MSILEMQVFTDYIIQLSAMGDANNAINIPRSSKIWRGWVVLLRIRIKIAESFPSQLCLNSASYHDQYKPLGAVINQIYLFFLCGFSTSTSMFLSWFQHEKKRILGAVPSKRRIDRQIIASRKILEHCCALNSFQAGKQFCVHRI